MWYSRLPLEYPPPFLCSVSATIVVAGACTHILKSSLDFTNWHFAEYLTLNSENIADFESLKWTWRMQDYYLKVKAKWFGILFSHHKKNVSSTTKPYSIEMTKKERCYDIYEHTCARAPNPYRYTHRTYLSDEQQSLCPIFRVLDCKLIERSVLCQLWTRTNKPEVSYSTKVLSKSFS